MKILLYSDVHISRTSSILPTTYKDTGYTYRQQMILDTGIWISELVKSEKPDMIVNLGDTFDQHTLTSYDIEIARQFFDNFKSINIPHYVLVGNHEMINNKYNAVALLNSIQNITVIDKPTTIQNLVFLPYMDYKTITCLPDGDVLFSHNDIQGSNIRGNILLPDGINKDSLSKYKLVFNGHIHKYGILNNIINIGSCTTHSFSDDNNSIPKVFIFDTETFNLTSFSNTYCPLFRSYEVNTVQDITNFVNSLDKSFTYILHITCPFEIKEDVKQILDSIKLNTQQQNNIIVNYKLNVKVNSNNKQKLQECNEINKDIKTNLDVTKSFTDFLHTIDLKYPLEMYIDILK